MGFRGGIGTDVGREIGRLSGERGVMRLIGRMRFVAARSRPATTPPRRGKSIQAPRATQPPKPSTHPGVRDGTSRMLPAGSLRRERALIPVQMLDEMFDGLIRRAGMLTVEG